MDFWAQHKDFVLKVLAGLGVFLVALIARGITYGDELEKATGKNGKLTGDIGRMQIASGREIEAAERDGEVLQANAERITRQIGWDLGDDMIEVDLVKRILSYTRRFGSPEDATQRAIEVHEAIRQDVDGGFGQLRLIVRQQMLEEASEKNIALRAGLGLGDVLEVKDGELLKYLMQLELIARIVRYAIDAEVDSVEEVKITTKVRKGPIPNANPAFLEEYPVTVVFRGSQETLVAILNRLENTQNAPRPPIREMRISRLDRPVDHLQVEMEALAVAANARVSFAPPKEES